ncbi:hypothetical protein H9638_08305 [Arthrobacter sp. Sa2BUA2]|uniref:Sulphur transport domain-containing protein n=1 Tax=Arthrobacter pullicola TaxID=2762224 RepID=A0ABR8YHX9_9MICC|nr:hypothetical protein [Arthrobacter pullicola]MBD8043815.1 hypothetical protein [Arthrobacter pullicola]
MSNTPARARRSVFFLIPLGALAGMALAILNFQRNYASAVESQDLTSYILWTLIGGAALGASFACPAGVVSFLSADAGKSRHFCAAAAALVLAACWLLYAGVPASGGTPVTVLLPVAAVVTTAVGTWFVWFTTRPKAPAAGPEAA